MSAFGSPLPAKSAAARAFNIFNLATVTIGAESSHARLITIQLQDAKGRNIAQVAGFEFYLATTAAGTTITPTVPTTTLAVATYGTLLTALVSGKMWSALSDVTGKIDLTLAQTAAVNYYLIIKCPDGSLIASSIIAFAG